MPRPKKV